MAEELTNQQLGEGEEPFEPIDNTKVLIAITKKTGQEHIAVTAEEYGSFDKRKYSTDGIIIRNEDIDVDLLYALYEVEAVMGDGDTDIPETDKRRKNAPSNPSFNELDGEYRTAWQMQNHPDTHESGCAVCEALKFGWLNSCGEATQLRDHRDAFNEACQAVGATPVGAEARYWTSTQYDKEYMWHLDMATGVFGFWVCKATRMMVRPVKSAADYIEPVMNN